MSDAPLHYPEQVPLKAYGDGAFRFADFRHVGGLISLPSGLYDWPFQTFDELNEASFEKVFEETPLVDFLILGTGPRQIRPSASLLHAFEKRNIWLEVMDSGAGARTLNVLLAEERIVAAALLPVD